MERESSMFSSDSKEPVEAKKKSGGSARLKNKFVGKHEHAGLGEQIGVHVLRFKNREDLAINHVEHSNPDLASDRLQPILLDSRWERFRVRGKPNLEQFFRA